MSQPLYSTVGELLRKARERKGLTIEEVNRQTRISLQVLSALEQDDLDTFESETYLKGFIKNYATFLECDLDLVMGALGRQQGKKPSGKGALWDIEETMTEEKIRSPKILIRVVLPLLLLVILLLSLLLIHEYRKNNSTALESSRTPLRVESG
jgi:cytoskeleton protein RodZ